ncbi:MAG TPA: SDR family oxidoreductase [Acidimicrobiales bacterium]|nr:SDR family oxidoreductase [Acidimicrobiales bacterium]
MDLRLEGRIALVTGGSRGIGRAIAGAMADAGARVLISSRKAEALEAAAAEIGHGCDWFAANAGDEAEAAACVAACVERFGGIDILVNNAATNPYMGPMLGIDASRANKTVQVNQWGVLRWTQLAVDAGLGAAPGAAVVNIASIGGINVGGGIGWYNVTKAAVIHVTKQLALEAGPNVRVNAIAPGLVKTDMAKALVDAAGDQLAKRLPMKRLGEPDDIAGAAVFLASDAASWITGHTLVVDGGALLGGG